MPTRIEFDVITGVSTVIPLTQAEIDAATAATATVAVAAAAAINPDGFIMACKTAFGGPTGILALPATVQSAINLTLTAISLGDWPDVQAYIILMQTALGTTYTAIKAAAVQYNIPIALP